MTTFEQPINHTDTPLTIGAYYEQTFNELIRREWGSPRKEDEKLRKELGGLAHIADLLDEYYATVTKRNDAIALVSPDFDEGQAAKYDQFVHEKQLLMTRAAYACMGAFFDLHDDPSERAHFATGLILDTEEIEARRLSDLLDYSQVHDSIVTMDSARALTEQIKRIQRKGGDDYDARAIMFSWYRNKFSPEDASYLQECVLEAKEQ